MPRKKTTDYDNTSITTLKGADRVRKRPAVIFGSDGIDGCQHSVFEILSNSIDEAREGYGKKITVTRYSDGSIEVEDHGRGIPVDYNENEKRYNWELVFCELYAGGKYNNNEGESYEFSLGMNGLGLCSTQYSSEYMDVDIRRDGYRYTLRFEKGEIVGKLKKEPYSKKDTGTKIHWKPDLEVFTDIDIQPEYFLDIMKRQAIVNAGIEFVFRNQNGKSFDTTSYNYVNGIVDHVAEVVGENGLSSIQHWETEVKTRDRDDKPEYKCKMDISVAFSNKVHLTEYYHNSSWLEHGGAPDKAVRNAFVYQIDSYLKQNNKDRIIFLGTQVDDYTANTLQAQLLYLDSVDPGKDISIYINSPGGSVYAGLGIYDTMQFISSDVATICTGMAASMAAVLLVAGAEGKRSALPHSRVMIHQPMGGAQGQASDIEITAREIQKLKKELYTIIADHSHTDFDKVWADSDRDYWMTAQEAKEYGMIDEVLIKK